MYDIAITVAACLRAGTRADVAWLVNADDLPVSDWSDAVVFTPGGGKTGSLLGGGLDGKLAEMAGRWSKGRLIDLEITQADALIGQLPSTGSARCLLAPADTLPAELWKLAAARERFCLVTELNDDEVAATRVFSQGTISEADLHVQEIFAGGGSGSTLTDEGVVSVFVAVPQIIVVGGGPVAEAVVELASFVGWRTQVASARDLATGLIAPLSGHDKVVVAAHDLELAGAGLAAAIESDCGYIGSVGSRKMQADRADWLAYRGVTDLTRVHGPAGLDIGAGTPEEIAVAIVAEAISESGGD
ncbi:MAG TPA: XdhC family protein [Acidimicrobiia bacterium]|nr:XdhC family protein [Acidimicrobiia bacterium]